MALELLDLDRTDYGRTGMARHSDRALIAAREHQERNPAAWHHIGVEMRKDAPPVRIVRRPRHPAPQPSLVARLARAITNLLTGHQPTHRTPTVSKHSMYPPAAMQAGKTYTHSPGSYGAFSTCCGICSQRISPAATTKRSGINVCADRAGCAERRKAPTRSGA